MKYVLCMTPRVLDAATFGVVVCGVFVIWVAASSTWSEAAITEAVGWAGIAAFVFAALALICRSWARLPLVGACVLSGLLIDAGFFTEYDPSAMSLVGYFFLGVLLTLTGTFAAVVKLLDILTRNATTQTLN